MAVPDMTTSAAAEYLAAHGYTVHSKRDGTDKPPNSTTVKQWCERGKIKARKSGWAWLVSKRELDELIKSQKEKITH
jgi:hypothetical protein